jgi:PTH1 family peptidyl-tRNA hydrolase
MALDTFAAHHGVSFIPKPKFTADIAELTYNGEKILLAKPATFYNETGRSARHLIDFYKLTPASDLLVLHDELALPLGVVRTRLSGSDAGNNGIKSLNSHLGINYARVRIGIFNSLRTQTNDADFVLGNFSQDEAAILPEVFRYVHHFIEQFLEDRFESTSKSLPLS